MAHSYLQYQQMAPNFRLITNTVDRNEVKFNLHFTAGGAFFEKKGQKGAAHLLEHCMLARTKTLDINQLKDFLFENDLYTNAYTGRLSMDLIVSGHKSDTQTMLDLILEFGFNPTITEEVLNQEKEVVLREMSQYTGGTGYRLNRILLEAMFEEDSYSRCEVLGERDDVANCTLDTFKDIRKRMLSDSHFIFTVSGGNLEVENIRKTIQKFVDKLYSENPLPIDFQPKNILRDFKYLPIVNDLGHDHAVVKIIIPCSVTLDNRPTRSFLKELLFDSPTGYLYDRLRDQLGMIYGLQYAFDPSSNSLSLEVSCEIFHVTSIIDEVRKAFSNFDSIITDKKVDIIRKLIVKRKELNEDDPQFVLDFLVGILTDYGVIVYYEDYIRQLESVTIEDIRKLYNEIYDSLKEMRVIVVSNKEEIKELQIFS